MTTPQPAALQAQPADESPCACWPGRMCSRSARCARDAQPAEVSDEQIREVFLANGFTIKDGLADLKPYVYAAARALLALRPQAVPMTDAQVNRILIALPMGDGFWLSFARAIEAHHSITAQGAQTKE